MDGTGLLFLYELNDTIDTNWFAGLRVDEDVRRVHVFKVQAFADIVYSVTVTIVMEAFRAYHLVYLYFSSESLAVNIRLCEDDSEQSV